MDAAEPADRDDFTTDVSAALEVAGRASTSKTRKARASHFGTWCAFCQKLNKSPALVDVYGPEEKLSYLLVYLARKLPLFFIAASMIGGRGDWTGSGSVVAPTTS